MDITNLFSILQNSNINLSEVVNTVSKLFARNSASTPPKQTQQPSQNYYDLPNYDFDRKIDKFGSTMQGTMHCIIPKQKPVSSQKEQSSNLQNILELIQILSPLFASKQQNSTTETQSKTTVQNQNLPPSQIQKLTRINNNT